MWPTLKSFAAGVSKAAAIGKLARQIGADTVTVYGDNLNDLSMFARGWRCRGG